MHMERSEKHSIWLLFELVNRLKPRLLEVAEMHNATLQQLHIVSLLGDGPPQSMSWFANHLYCDASNVTGIVDRLYAQGIVVRRESEKDRRIKMIALTPKGRELRQTLMTAFADEAAFAALTPAEKQEFTRLLLKLRAAFDDQNTN